MDESELEAQLRGPGLPGSRFRKSGADRRRSRRCRWNRSSFQSRNVSPRDDHPRDPPEVGEGRPSPEGLAIGVTFAESLASLRGYDHADEAPIFGRDFRGEMARSHKGFAQDSAVGLATTHRCDLWLILRHKMSDKGRERKNPSAARALEIHPRTAHDVIVATGRKACFLFRSFSCILPKRYFGDKPPLGSRNMITSSDARPQDAKRDNIIQY